MIRYSGQDATDQHVIALAGSLAANIRLRLIHWDRLRQHEFRALEWSGVIDDLDLRADEMNKRGYNVYIGAQAANPPPFQHARDSDVTAVRLLFADGDAAPLPATWHVEPSWTLLHPNGRWWAGWAVNDVPLSELRSLQARIARFYGSDPKVVNASRVIRLAGFSRWKDGKQSEAYDFIDWSAT